MLHLHEYQSKQLISERGIPVPDSGIATSPEEAASVFQTLDAGRAAVKAQVHAGGRGKAGGIELVESPEEAEAAARNMIGERLVTHQTGPEGKPVHEVLVEAGCFIDHEYYVGITLNREEEAPELIASSEGGVDIETIAEEHPDQIYGEVIHPTQGLQPFQQRRMIQKLELEGETAKQAASIFQKLADLYVDLDCQLLELNPLASDEKGNLTALDCKINIDDRSLYKHEDLKEMRDEDQEDPTERRAGEAGLSYIDLEGTIGCLVNGAGLAMATMDLIKLHGGEPANFLDVGGGADEEQVRVAFDLLFENPNVRAVLVNIFGGIMRCDVIASGMIGALEDIELDVPLVVRLQGTASEKGRKLLRESDLEITPAQNLNGAAKKAVEAATAG